MKVIAETTKGTYLAPTLAGHVYDLKCESTAEYIKRVGSGLYMGIEFQGREGEPLGRCSFKTELKGDGSHHLDPFCAVLMEAGGFVKATEVYSMSSSIAAQSTISIAVWENGKKKMLQGCYGKTKFNFVHGKPIELECEFFGYWIAPIDEAIPTWSPSTREPILFGSGMLTVATNLLNISKATLDMGIVVTNLSGIYYIMSNYDGPIITLDPTETLVATYDFHGIKKAGTEAAIAIAATDGVDIITFTLPKVQCKELKDGEREGLKILDWTGECHHSSGNDAVSIAVT
jgi:hypothetical protein